MKKVLAILLALLVGAAAAAGGIFYFHMKAQPKVDAKGLMERLEESSELTVEKSYYKVYQNGGWNDFARFNEE